MTLTVPRLPPELTDKIIREVNHRATLVTCSLVCRSWLPASRYALFRNVQVWNAASYDLFVSRVLFSESMRPYLSYVYEMNLQNGRGLNGRPEPWLSFFQLFTGHLPNLISLSVWRTNWEDLSPHPNTPLLLSALTSIQVLILHACHFPSFGYLRRTLSALPSLRDLTVSMCTWPGPSSQNHLMQTALKSDRPKLTALNLLWDPYPPDRLRAQQLVSWLASSATSSTLRTLDFLVVSTGRGGPANRGYVDFFGPSFPALLRSVSCVRMVVNRTESIEGAP